MQWQSLIESQNKLQYPTQITSADKPILIGLPTLAVLKVYGSDASSFLQNMLTNDLNSLSDQQGQLSGICDPKGRLLALFYIIKQGENFYLILSADLIDYICQRLNMFKLRSDVTINAMETQVFGMVNIPQTDTPEWHLFEKASVNLLRLPASSPRFIGFGDVSTIEQQDYLIGDTSLWHYYDIDAGLPMVFDASKEAFVPQQINLDIVDGVSFKKGCFPGQEIIARMHYLGKPSRRLYTASCELAARPDIYSTVTDESGNIAGHVVQMAKLDAQTLLLQISLKIADSDKPLFVDKYKLDNLKADIEENEQT